jgi:acyl carrier protein
MISGELKTAILRALRLDDWDITNDTKASEIPGWDSLNHVNVVLEVEKSFNIHFKGAEVLRLKNIGELQNLVDAKVAQRG